MATYIIIKNAMNGNITKINLTKKGGGMFMELHSLIRNEYDNGFLGDGITDRKKHIIANVMIFKDGKRLNMGFRYTLQNKKIDFTNVEIPPINDSECPHCGNDEIEFDGDRAFGSNEASQEVYCAVCDCHWHNVYKFSGVQILN